MSTILLFGVIVFTGFIFGEIADKFKLPKVAGYIIAGVCMNPHILRFIPEDFPSRADSVTNIALAFITFSIGGSLYFKKIKRMGKDLLYITIFEGEMAFLVILIAFALLLPLLFNLSAAGGIAAVIPISLMIACLGAPTDPSAILAVRQEYGSKGRVTDTILGVAAFDDVLGILNYSVAVVIAETLIKSSGFDLVTTALKPAIIIAGSICIGAVLGFILNFVTGKIQRETEGVLIMVICGLLSVCFGFARLTGADEILSVMVMGMIVVNFNPLREKIFKMLERYVDELIFVIFFAISGMYLDIKVIAGSAGIIILFIIARILGKFTGVFIGASLAGSRGKVKKYSAGGLIPQGGIVIGLALMIKQNPAFSGVADIIINVIISTTIINEFAGPIFAEIALKKAGELK